MRLAELGLSDRVKKVTDDIIEKTDINNMDIKDDWHHQILLRFAELGQASTVLKKAEKETKQIKNPPIEHQFCG